MIKLKMHTCRVKRCDVDLLNLRRAAFQIASLFECRDVQLETVVVFEG